MEGTIRATESTASPERLFEVAADLEAYPAWAEGVTHVEVLERDTSGRAVRARFEIEALVRRITYVLNYSYDEPTKITWTADPGDDIEAMEGSYSFEPQADGGTEIVYVLAVKPAFPIPGFLRGQAERHIVSMALRSLKKRAEAG